MKATDEVTNRTKAQPVGLRPRSSATVKAAMAAAIAPYHCRMKSIWVLIPPSPSPRRRPGSRRVKSTAHLWAEIPAFAGMTEIGSSCRADQFAADQHAADLVGAGADVEQLGVAHVAFDRPVLGVAGAAQGLDRLERGFHRILAGEQDRAGGVEAGGPAGVAGAGDGVDVGAGRVEGDIHVGDLGLDQLEASDRLAELLALADIGKDGVQTGLHDAELDAGEHGALVIEARHQDSDA